MMKKTVTLILALSLAAGVMSGCGKRLRRWMKTEGIHTR